MTDLARVLRRRQVPGRTGSMGITMIRAASGGLPAVLAWGAALADPATISRQPGAAPRIWNRRRSRAPRRPVILAWFRQHNG